MFALNYNVFRVMAGMGGLVSPHETSKEIAKQGTLGSYISGRSYQGSDGKA